MASGEVVIQSMWSPAVTAVRSRSIDCYYVPLKEGYRGWFVGLAPMAHLSGHEARCAYEYMNWYNSGWQGGFIAKQGYYSAVPDDGEEVPDPGRMGLLVRRQARRGRHQGPYGTLMEKKGATRDGGAYLGPHGQHRLLEHA